MKKYLLVIILSFLCFACSEEKKEEDKVKSTVESFYKCINDRDFKTMATIVSPNMNNALMIIKTLSSDLVSYKQYTVKDVVISGDKAKVNVDCIDCFDNKMECTWDLIRINNSWKMNNFNFSFAQEEQMEQEQEQDKTKIPYKGSNTKGDTIEVKTE
jgi:PBP1b-binding outer membrane lipoprotein LpoB